MVKFEDIQSYGKEQFEQAVANATTFQSGIFFDILTVLIQCGSTDTVQFSTGKHRF